MHLEHVEVVGAGAGADGHQRTARSRSTGATPLEIFMLLCGLCDTAARGQSQQCRSMMVCADGAGVEHAQRIEVFDGRHAVFLRTMRTRPAFGDMGHQVQSVPLGRLLPRRRFSGDTV